MGVNFKARIRFLYFIIFALATILVARLFIIQVVQREVYVARANRQQQGSINTLLERGSIFFQTRDGKKVSAATLQNGFTIAINPRLITKPDLTYTKLSEVLSLDREDFFQKATKDDPYEVIFNRVNKEEADAVRALGLTGVILEADRWRFYPGDQLAAHTIGFMAYEGKEYAGRYGLERQYERVLKRDPEMNFVTFITKVFSDLGSALGRKKVASADLVLTIEPTVQQSLEIELDTLADRWQAESIGGIIINPQTGAVVAMAARPTFDPNRRLRDISLLRNPLVENVYEMGSIVKPLTLASAIDTGAISAETTYHDYGVVTVENRQISNYDKRGRGVVSMQEVLNQSLNTGVVFAMQKMGKEKLRDYLLSFGLGEKSGIDLPDEITSLVKNLSSRREIELATASFGQGLALTPISIAKALSVLANDGMLVQPQVVQALEFEDSESVAPIKPILVRRVIKSETSQEITRMLVSAVDNALLGGTVKLPHYSVAAKTGTAQISKPGGGYYDDRYLHSFFGYFPAYDAQFLTFIYMVNPRNARYASDTLTGPFMNLTKFLLNYYNIPPDR